MTLRNSFIFDFTHQPEQPEEYDFHLGSDFFGGIENAEISGGDVALRLILQPVSKNRLMLKWHYVGNVVVACDRCLDPLTLEMKVDEALEVLIGTELDDENDEVITLNAQDPVYDFTWIAYELLALHLPIQKMHDIEDCNPKMLKYLNGTVDDLPEEDPRWDELRQQLKRKK